MKYQDKVKMIREHLETQTPEIDQQKVLQEAVVAPSETKSPRFHFKLQWAYSLVFAFILIIGIIIIMPKGMDKAKDIPGEFNPINANNYDNVASISLAILFENNFIPKENDRNVEYAPNEEIDFLNKYLYVIENLKTIEDYQSKIITYDVANVSKDFNIVDNDNNILINVDNKVFTIDIHETKSNKTYVIEQDDNNLITINLNKKQLNVFDIGIVKEDQLISSSKITFQSDLITIENTYIENVKNVYEIVKIDKEISINAKQYQTNGDLIGSKKIEVKLSNQDKLYTYSIYENSALTSEIYRNR